MLLKWWLTRHAFKMVAHLLASFTKLYRQQLQICGLQVPQFIVAKGHNIWKGQCGGCQATTKKSDESRSARMGVAAGVVVTLLPPARLPLHSTYTYTYIDTYIQIHSGSCSRWIQVPIVERKAAIPSHLVYPGQWIEGVGWICYAWLRGRCS